MVKLKKEEKLMSECNQLKAMVNICCGELLRMKNILIEYTEGTFFNSAEGDSCTINFQVPKDNKMEINYHPEYNEDSKPSELFEFNYCPFCGFQINEG